MKITSTPHILLDLPSRYSIYKRIALLILAILLSLVCIYVWYTTYSQLNNYSNKQANELGRGLVNQYQVILSDYLLKKNHSKMQLIIDAIVNDQHVLAATIFDAEGREVISNPADKHFLRLYANHVELVPLTFVSEITSEGQKLGYLRLILDGSLANGSIEQLNNAYLQRALVMMLLALLVGIILTRSFYLWRMKSIKMKKPRML
ncbi:hypothetical protein KIH87_06930 [Paraneptunicella aestuarii]|uniref:AhpA/YtjB family protein n=1 Tax=Paraneptunicella aestuarii TaxID=2831148 RepID=UPI001E47AC28|nr:AhpA/YtjB family protein [Paraneptunicella aestuarii]UAA40078.1 hypothetical protein KIH87_06930 [Paraneptunicella aestuarii]